jgi:hypothetical protein
MSNGLGLLLDREFTQQDERRLRYATPPSRDGRGRRLPGRPLVREIACIHNVSHSTISRGYEFLRIFAL